jgi:cation diffusion facilitator family transporter
MTTHTHDLGPWRHSHRFDRGNRDGETRTRWVLMLTLVTMTVEVGAGWWTGSMALLADGWHMGTHALALGIATLAYAVARGHGDDARYAFGTWKIEVLGGFASALVLVLVALAIAAESALRLWRAEPVSAQAALLVALIGLAVNLGSA